MPKRRVGRRRGNYQSWLEDVRCRIRLTWAATCAFPDLRLTRSRRNRGYDYTFTLTLPVEGYDDRRVEIRFDQQAPNTPIVLVDGPEDSPHRYPSSNEHHRRLCLWHPSDPDDRRWSPHQGLLTLIGMIKIHLFKEGWYRETGRWIGEEYPHEPDVSKEAA